MHMQCSINEGVARWVITEGEHPQLDVYKNTLLLVPHRHAVSPELQRVKALYACEEYKPRESRIEFTNGNLEVRSWGSGTRMELMGKRYECIIVNRDCEVNVNDLINLSLRVKHQ